MSARLKAKARIRLTIEVALEDTWGSDCQIGQLHEQAAREALAKVSNKLCATPCPVRWCIIGNPVVTGIMTEEETL